MEPPANHTRDALNALRLNSNILQICAVAAATRAGIGQQWGWLAADTLGFLICNASHRHAIRQLHTLMTDTTTHVTFHYNPDGTRKDKP